MIHWLPAMPWLQMIGTEDLSWSLERLHEPGVEMEPSWSGGRCSFDSDESRGELRFQDGSDVPSWYLRKTNTKIASNPEAGQLAMTTTRIHKPLYNKGWAIILPGLRLITIRLLKLVAKNHAKRKFVSTINLPKRIDEFWNLGVGVLEKHSKQIPDSTIHIHS